MLFMEFGKIKDNKNYIDYDMYGRNILKQLDERCALDQISSTFQNDSYQEIEFESANKCNNSELDLFSLLVTSITPCEIISNTFIKTKRTPSLIELELDKSRDCLKMAMEKRYHNMKNKNLKKNVDAELIDEGVKSDETNICKPFKDLELIKTDIKACLAKSNVMVSLEQQKILEKFSKRAHIKINQIERAKTKGTNWYNMPAPEITEEMENDLKILRMRTALNSKRFYKKNDLKILPKYFQIGVIQHSPLEHYSECYIRRNKRCTLVDELLADSQAQTYTKRKYKEIMVKKNKYKYSKVMNKKKKVIKK